MAENTGLAAASAITKGTVSLYPLRTNKTVTIKHIFTKSILPEVGDYNAAEGYVQRLGGALKTGTNIPLGRFIFDGNEELERAVMTKVIGISPNSVDWENKLNEYWHNFSLAIPFLGKTLNCNTVQMSESGLVMPVNPTDYVAYKYALIHREVSNTVEESNKSGKIRFFLWDAKEALDKKIVNQAIKDKALMARIKLTLDAEAVKSVLTIMGRTPATSTEESNFMLVELAEKLPLEFIAACEDKNLQTKAFITKAVTQGVLNQPVNSSIILFESVTIGHTLDEAVAWINDAANVVAKRTIEAKLK